MNQLDDEGLLKTNIETNHFTGLSRREIIRKVGFASAIALPMISSIVAPKASMAQSMGGVCIPIHENCGEGFGTNCCETNVCLTAGYLVDQRCCSPLATGNVSLDHPGFQVQADEFCYNPSVCNQIAPHFCCSGKAVTQPGTCPGSAAPGFPPLICVCA